MLRLIKDPAMISNEEKGNKIKLVLHDPVEDREIVEEDHWCFLSQEKGEFW